MISTSCRRCARLVGCGVDVNLRTNSSMRLSTVKNQEALSTVDTEDVNAAIVYHFQWRTCS